MRPPATRQAHFTMSSILYHHQNVIYVEVSISPTKGPERFFGRFGFARGTGASAAAGPLSEGGLRSVKIGRCGGDSGDASRVGGIGSGASSVGATTTGSSRRSGALIATRLRRS